MIHSTWRLFPTRQHTLFFETWLSDNCNLSALCETRGGPRARSSFNLDWHGHFLRCGYAIHIVVHPHRSINAQPTTLARHHRGHSTATAAARPAKSTFLQIYDYSRLRARTGIQGGVLESSHREDPRHPHGIAYRDRDSSYRGPMSAGTSLSRAGTVDSIRASQ